VCQAGSIARYAPQGYLMFLDAGVTASHRRLLARRFDAGRLRASGDAQLVLDQVSTDNFGYSNASAGDRGTLAVQHWSNPHSRLVWRDRHGVVTGVACEDVDCLDRGNLSPDGHRLAYAGSDPRDLFVLDLATGISTRLTFENQLVSFLVWSPDGRRIVFARVGSRGWEARIKAADGAGQDSLVFHGLGLFSFPQAWSRDGRWLLVRSSDPSGNYDFWRVPMTGAGKPEVYQKTAAQEVDASLSPDGRWVAYTADEEGKRSLYVQSFPDPGAKYEVNVANVGGAGWAESGDALMILTTQGEVLQVQVSTAGGFRQGATTRLFQLPQRENIVDVERGEQRVLTATRKDLMASTKLEVVMGWPELLEKK
jgi:hypothetical protein